MAFVPSCREFFAFFVLCCPSLSLFIMSPLTIYCIRETKRYVRPPSTVPFRCLFTHKNNRTATIPKNCECFQSCRPVSIHSVDYIEINPKFWPEKPNNLTLFQMCLFCKQNRVAWMGIMGSPCFKSRAFIKS